jgi:hypothetical protein
VERIVYDRYRMAVIGSIPIKMQLSKQFAINRKAQTCVLSSREMDKSMLHKKARRENRGTDD